MLNNRVKKYQLNTKRVRRTQTLFYYAEVDYLVIESLIEPKFPH